MKRFLVFAGNSHYADGGALDLQDDCDTLETAMVAATVLRRSFDWFHILDSETHKILAFSQGSYCVSARHDFDPEYDDKPPPSVTSKDAVEYWPDANGVLKKVDPARS